MCLWQETEAAKKAKREREAVQQDVKVEHWLHEGIIVKIVNKTLNDGKYHKRKGVVLVSNPPHSPHRHHSSSTATSG
jgi:hypothetical protein